MAKSKLLPGLLFTLLLMFFGLAIGTIIGATFFVAPGSGLAGPAIALGYGVIGAVVALGLSIVLARMLPRAHLIKGVYALSAVVVVLIAVGVVRNSTRQVEHEASWNEEDYAHLLAFDLRLVNDTMRVTTRSFNAMTVNARERTFEVVPAGNASMRCTGRMTGPEHERLLEALNGVIVVMEMSPTPCADTYGEVSRVLHWGLDEATGPHASGEVEVTESCLQKHEAFLDVTSTLHKMHMRALHTVSCR